MKQKESPIVAKILLVDIETAPAKVYSWGLFDQNIGINQIVSEPYVLCWCAMWHGDKDVMSDALINHKTFFRDHPRDDRMIAKSIHKLMDDADIVVTHNGNNFDLKWLNTIFVKHHLNPIQGYKSIDTCSAAKNHFKFLSNKLDFLCRSLGLGAKIDTGGFELWTECMAGDKVAWDKMVTYCKNDVRILGKLYDELRPFIKNHPNMALYSRGNDIQCPTCGSLHYFRHGYHYTAIKRKQRLECKSCGKRFTIEGKYDKMLKTRSV